MNRAQRRANTKRVIKNRLNELKEVNKSYYKYVSKKTNKLNKQDAFDCGKPNCICKLEKNYSTLDNKGNKRRSVKYDLKDLQDDKF